MPSIGHGGSRSLRCRLGYHDWIEVTVRWKGGGPGIEDRQCLRCRVLQWEHHLGRTYDREIARITTGDTKVVGRVKAPPRPAAEHERAPTEPPANPPNQGSAGQR